MKIEYRLAPKEFRFEAGENEVRIEGMAVPYDKKIDYGGYFTESMKSGAFLDGIREDTVLLANHQGLPFARVGGGTLEFKHKRDGLYFEALLDTRDNEAQSIAVKIERQDLTGVSVGFYSEEEHWMNDDDEREIVRATLHEISVVHNPAYADTHVAKSDRNIYEAAIESRNRCINIYNDRRIGFVKIDDDLETEVVR